MLLVTHASTRLLGETFLCLLLHLDQSADDTFYNANLVHFVRLRWAEMLAVGCDKKKKGEITILLIIKWHSK